MPLPIPIPFLDKTIVKLGLALAILTLLVGFAKWGYDSIYQAGVNSVVAEVAGVYSDREKELEAKLAKMVADKKQEQKDAAALQAKLDKSESDNRKLRDDINDASFECESIGSEFMELWNKAVSSPS